MRFPTRLHRGRLQRRYKRFLADVELEETGELVQAHCPNPGSMSGCDRPGSLVLLSHHPESKRKLLYSWEMVRVGRRWVGINTALTNRIVEHGLRNDRIPELSGFDEIRREVPYGERSRVDFVLRDAEGDCYVEVKNVTLADRGVARFPDSVTARGAKHLRELLLLARQGTRAVMLFLVNRGDCDRVEVAEEIDPTYAQELLKAVEGGVEVLAYDARVTARSITVAKRLPFRLPSSGRRSLPPLVRSRAASRGR